jgi:hypothetical protein
MLAEILDSSGQTPTTQGRGKIVVSEYSLVVSRMRLPHPPTADSQ